MKAAASRRECIRQVRVLGGRLVPAADRIVRLEHVLEIVVRPAGEPENARQTRGAAG